MSELQGSYGASQQYAKELNGKRCAEQAAEFNNLAKVFGPLQVMDDQLAERLDELADLSEIWKRRRASRSEVGVVREALIRASAAIAALQSMEFKR